jgi:hypothetical protein
MIWRWVITPVFADSTAAAFLSARAMGLDSFDSFLWEKVRLGLCVSSESSSLCPEIGK